MPDSDVLIVGAGPTGLVLALWLTRFGVRVRIIDKTAEPSTTSRALAVQARTLELYDQLGLGRVVVDRGRKVGGVTMWVAGRLVAHAPIGDLGGGIGPHPYPLIFPQDEHERLLIDCLAERGVTVERGTELTAFQTEPGRVIATLKRSDGSTSACQSSFIAGCDGAHSRVRELLSIGFPGGTYEHLFYVADVEAAGRVMNGDVHVALDPTDFLAVFPLKGERRARLVGTIREEFARRHEELSWPDVSKRVIEWMQIDVARVNWLSTYRVHHRVADRFQSGRAFLLGDAAHIHSPVGGQGMNTGIGDAINLAWKLAAAVHGTADPSILDTYEPERIAFARRLVATTDQAFTAVTSSTAFARAVRLRIVPLLMPVFFAFRSFRRFVFRTVSQTAINYRGSWLSEGRAGRLSGGDRLPWIQLHEDGPTPDNFAPLTSLDWQVHVYGTASDEVRKLCHARRLTLCAFPWRAAMAESDVRQNAVYLVRPDGYLGLVDESGNAAALESYLDRRGVLTRSESPRL